MYFSVSATKCNVKSEIMLATPIHIAKTFSYEMGVVALTAISTSKERLERAGNNCWRPIGPDQNGKDHCRTTFNTF